MKQFGKRYVSVIEFSTSAAVFHNVGQLFAASIIFKNFQYILYLPILSIAGIGTGIFIVYLLTIY